MVAVSLAYSESITSKPDFLMKNDSGEVVKRGIYTTGANGEVLRYDIRSEKTGEIMHTEIPIYDSGGQMALTKVYDGEGDLKLIILKTTSGYAKLDPNGDLLSNEEFERLYQSDYAK